MSVADNSDGCSFSSFTRFGYGDCKKDHSNGKGKFCYVNLPTTCSDAESSAYVQGKQLSWEACVGKRFEICTHFFAFECLF